MYSINFFKIFTDYSPEHISLKKKKLTFLGQPLKNITLNLQRQLPGLPCVNLLTGFVIHIDPRAALLYAGYTMRPGDHCQSEKRQCQILHKSLRQTNILQTNRLFKQGRDLFIPEASDPAADVRYIEE